MSIEQNTEVVQSGYEKFKTGDIEGLLNLFTDDIRWTVPEIENAPFAGSRKGKEAVAQFFQQLSDAEEISRFEPLEFVAQGEKVVVLGDSAATVKATGRSYETDWVHVFHMKDGKVHEFQEFFDNAAATKAFQLAAGA
ncbi:MAG TPA: nuclear transport factor 2 family protein [Pyrinomonadaceae bacterium]|jgi:ketosteroid isomerase-like protein|nr:nuclear transport factor 2 family protein [Pyrinomonadaceae bacterium]